jgi:hypothetical protein
MMLDGYIHFTTGWVRLVLAFTMLVCMYLGLIAKTQHICTVRTARLL